MISSVVIAMYYLSDQYLWCSPSIVRSESISRPTQTDNWGSALLCLPPIITHTAATPQGSPNATLESINSSHLSPKLALTISEHHTTDISLAADNNSPPHLVCLSLLHFLIISNHYHHNYIIHRINYHLAC